MSQDSLVRSLGLKEAAALVVGSVVGTGVFTQAATMSQQARSPLWVLLAWAAGGILSLCGALCYAELGGMFPRAGGDYVFLRESYGRGVGFLFGWIRFWVVSPGSIAAYAVGAATFLSSPFGLDEAWKRSLFAALMVGAFSALNCLSVTVGGRVQEYLTALKIALILGLAGAILAIGGGSTANLATSLGNSGSAFPGWTPFGAAMIAALFAYDGWNNMPMAAGEIRHPGKNIPLALGLGMLAVLGIYCLANFAYFYALPISEIASSFSTAHPDALPAATRVSQAMFGDGTIKAFSFFFAISAVGALNGSVLSNARVPYAMAHDGLFFRKLGEISHKARVPVASIWAQAAVSVALAATGTFDQLTVAIVFASWIFYALAAGSVFIFRQKLPHAHRAYRVPLYPWLPLLFIGAAIFLLASALLTSPLESGLGLAFTFAGIPAYLWFRAQQRKAPGASA